MQFRLTFNLVASFVFLIATASWSQTITATQTNPSGIYTPGEQVTWTIQATGDNVPSLTAVDYAIKENMFTVLKEGKIDLSKGPVQLSASIDKPGTIVVSLKLQADEKPQKSVAGAIFAPEQIRPSAPAPSDFDAFWKEKVSAVEAVALNPKVEKGKVKQAGVEYYKVRLDNINGTHVYGQLAKPAKSGKFPAVLIFQSAGVSALPVSQVLPRAQSGYLAMNIMAHDLPMDEDDAFYKKALETTHKGYIRIGNDDREKSYFLRMFLGCYQAARYLTTREDWNGKTLIVMGGSQGGMQALATAGLHPSVTAVLANVPAGCDVTGVNAGRATGFPYWRGGSPTPDQKAIEVGRYFDIVNFAARIKVPALVSTGLIDETCPAAGVMSAFNSISGPKERIILPTSDHHGTGGTQKDFTDQSNAWLAKLAKGQPHPSPKQPQ